MSAPSPSADRNLVLGLLALQMDFVTREQLLDAMAAWMLDKHTPLGEILCRRGALTEGERDVLDQVMQQHIERHGDAQASLAAMDLEPTVRRQLEDLGDTDVQDSLASTVVSDPLATLPYISADAFERARRAAPAGAPAPARFRRLRLHAAGGVGEVSVALDEELQREVALKEIQERFADQADARARFVREAEITGNLEHPGVVPVYGLGAYPNGRPFYAMRFIRGQSLKEAIARFHTVDEEGGRDEGERSLALRDLLGRFVGVCNTVAYAHSRGVLHRDLKPDNVMLGEYGETLVVDWGLARLLSQADSDRTAIQTSIVSGSGGDSLPTQMGQVVGTPAYMPPEQASGRVDQVGPASDVFALGGTLYCLLTGQPPYRGPDALAKARRAALVPARQIAGSVPAALEAVCGKAMAPRPEDRYATARALAEDVQRFLADEPVRAYREPFLDRLRRWSRRNRSLVSAAVMLLLAGVVGLAVGLWAVQREQTRTKQALARAEENLDRALQAEKRALANLQQAQANMALAHTAVDQCFNVARAHPLFQVPRMEKARKLLLEKTLPFYRQFRSQRPDDAALQREEAEQLFRVAYIEKVLGRSQAALQAYRQARDLRLVLAGANPDELAYQQDLAHAHNDLAVLLSDLGQRPEALTEHQKALAIRARLAKAHAGVPAYQNDLASSHNNLGILLRSMGKRPEAAREYETARTIRLRLAKSYPEVAQYWSDLAGTHNNLGIVLSEMGQRQDALQEYRQARDLRISLVKAYPQMAEYANDLASTHNSLGNLLIALGKRGEALPEHRQAVALRVRLVRANPDVPQYENDLASTRNNLAKLLAGLGKQPEAAKEYQQAREIQVRLVQAHPEVPAYTEGLARTCLNLGMLLAQIGQLTASLSELDEAMACTDTLHRLDPGNALVRSLLLQGLPQRAAVLTRLGRQQDAEANWDRALKLAPPAQRLHLLFHRAESLARAGDYQRAAVAAGEIAQNKLAPATVYNLACIHALSGAAAARDASRPLPHREKFAGQCVRDAVALLRRAAAAGFFRDPANLTALDSDDDLAFLRDRDDYSRFRAALKPSG
jgi:serine/threonine-protein kinase